MKNGKKWVEVGGLLFLFSAIGAVILFPGALASLLHRHAVQPLEMVEQNGQQLAWWDNIGGCGVGGAAGGGGGGATWVGRGVTGGLLNMDLMSTDAFAGDYEYKSFSSRFSTIIKNKNTIGITLPFSVKSGTYRFDTRYPPMTQMVGGFGDMSVDYARKFGSTEAHSVTLTVGLPTGRFDHRRFDQSRNGDISNNNSGSYVPPQLQPGTGLYSTTLGYEYTKDKDWGPIIMGCSYTAMLSSPADLFNANRNWGGQNDIWDRGKWAKDGYDLSGPLGTLGPNDYPYIRDENGKRGDALKGDFVGDAISAHVAMGLKQETCVHSIAISYTYKVEPDWYVRLQDPGATSATVNGQNRIYYLPVKSKDSQNTVNLSYGLEVSSMYFPVFLAGTLTLDQKLNKSYSGTMGVKGSFF